MLITRFQAASSPAPLQFSPNTRAQFGSVLQNNQKFDSFTKQPEFAASSQKGMTTSELKGKTATIKKALDTQKGPVVKIATQDGGTTAVSRDRASSAYHTGEANISSRRDQARQAKGSKRECRKHEAGSS